MKYFLSIVFLCFNIFQLKAQANNTFKEQLAISDWLIKAPQQKAEIFKSKDGKDVTLYNGLVKRSFRITPNVACIDYKNMTNGQQLLRAVKAEAIIKINGKEYNVGGLHGQQENAYLLPEWLNHFTSDKKDFQFINYQVDNLKPYINWKVGDWWTMNKNLPTGKMITSNYQSSLPELKGLLVKVYYEIYDGIHLIAKYVSIENKGTRPFKIDRIINENLAIVEEESAVVGNPANMKKQHGIYVETNYAFNNAMRYDISDQNP